jgi:hypothetical protein
MNKILTIILLVGCVITLYMFVDTAQGRSVDADAQLNLARCLIAETSGYSGKNNNEWAAMSWVLRKRQFQMSKRYRREFTLDETILRYCAVFNPGSRYHYGQRAVDIRRSTFDSPHHGKLKVWTKLQAFTARFMAGTVGDPCSEAQHFGNHEDVKGKTSYVEVCPELGKRGNKYYKIANAK